MQDPQKVLHSDRKLDSIRASNSIAELSRQRAKQAAEASEASESGIESTADYFEDKATSKRLNGQKSEVTQEPPISKQSQPRNKIGPTGIEPVNRSTWASAKVYALPQVTAALETEDGRERRPLAPIQERAELLKYQGKHHAPCLRHAGHSL